jgi:CRP-like cAMP-binding protein
MSPAERVARRLTSDSIISKSQNESLARMVRNVHERRFADGERIYRADEDARYLYLLEEGEVDLLSPLGKRVRVERRFGEEAATDVPHYLSDAVAVGEVAACLVPRASLAGLNL